YARARILTARAPEARVHVAIEEPALLAGGLAHARVRAETYFGAPLRQARIRWTVSTFRDYGHDVPLAGFTSQVVARPGEPERTLQEPLETQGEAPLDDEGAAVVPFTVDARCKQDEQSCAGVFEAEVIDAFGRGVAGRTSFVAWSGQHALGLKVSEHGSTVH